jgi:exodeoxyribonuclease V alpha subunit
MLGTGPGTAPAERGAYDSLDRLHGNFPLAQKRHQPEPGQGVEVTGTLTRFVFRNEASGFAVVRLSPEPRGAPVLAVGPLAQFAEGQRLKITGRIEDHPRFGRQIAVDSIAAEEPATTEGIAAYLGSGLVKGIGPATAARIVGAFGTETLRVIETDAERLREVKGLGRKRIAELVAAVQAQRDVQDVMVFLRAHGLGPGMAARIVKRYGNGAAALIRSNPFRLADEVIGIGFKRADQLARELGIAAAAPERIRAGLLHVLALAARDGDCYLREDELARRAGELLFDPGAPTEPIAAEMPRLIESGQLVTRPDTDDPSRKRVYPQLLFHAEASVAAHVLRLARQAAGALLEHAENAVAWFEQSGSLDLTEGQRTALVSALRSPLSVITGGPGVGKTTIIRGLAKILAAKRKTLLLAAPTGRAAKRLEESTGQFARTIHRLLEYQPGLHRFLKDDRDPLAGDMLVVDEASMLDVQLADQLLRAVPAGMSVVLVGDADQLPSVGPGNVLADLMRSGTVPTTRLTEIFRQRRDSHIVAAAHGVLRGAVPTSGGEHADFFFLETPDNARTRQLVSDLVAQRLPRAFGFEPLTDIQVLCPMYRGDAGADTINADLQALLNPRGAHIERAGRTLREGDKVMQIRNNYELDVFNGDAGRIVGIDAAASKLRIRFVHKEVEVPFADLDQIVPAYAITVHRAQGSEYPCVIVPLATDHFMMLRRNLLYTAITRGRRLVVLVGSAKALGMAVRNDQEAHRNTGLAELLRNAPQARGMDERGATSASC